MTISGPALNKLRKVWQKLFWAACNYTPSSGEFPIYDMEGELIHTSWGQQEFHDDPSRIKLMAGGVRAGKSKVLAMEAAKHLLVENGLCWIVGPDYAQTKWEFRYLLEGLRKLGYIKKPPSMPEHGAWSLETKYGYRIETKSSVDLETIASSATDLFVITEANQHKSGILEKAYERALEKQSPVLAGGTFENSSVWYMKAWERFQGDNEVRAHSFSLPSWTNPYVFKGGRNDPGIVELEKLLGPEKFLERCAAIPSKPEGLVHKAFNHRKHIKRLDFDPDLPIEIAIDPGQHTYAVEAIQWVTIPGQFMKDVRSGLMIPLVEVRVIDEVYVHDMIAQDVIPQVKAKPWFKYVKSGVIDTAGKQRGANLSQIEIWWKATGLSLRSQYLFIPESIDVLNLRLRDYPGYGLPLIYFDYRLSNDVLPNGKAMGIVGEMGLYKWPAWNEGTSERRIPININNDACKAVSYWLYDKFGPTEARKRGKNRRSVRTYH